jgi:hypothetical protein
VYKILTVLFVASTILPATNILYNFEDQPATSGNGALTSIVELAGGVTMTVTMQNNDHFDIANLSGSMPAASGWGNSSLSPFASDDLNAFVFTFSVPISSFSVQLGDFGGDIDSEVLHAYSGATGTGTLLASGTGNWGAQTLASNTPETDSVSAAGILSVTVIGGSASFPNSLYYDNVMISTSSTPEPGSILLTLAGIGALAGGSILRRRSART